MRGRKSIRTTADYDRFLKEDAERRGGCSALERLDRERAEIPDWDGEERAWGPRFSGRRKRRNRR